MIKEFNHVRSVLVSCKTQEQVKFTGKWIIKLMDKDILSDPECMYLHGMLRGILVQYNITKE